MKLGMMRVKVLEAATAAALETAVATWLATLTEEKVVVMLYQVPDSSHYSVLIAYTE